MFFAAPIQTSWPGGSTARIPATWFEYEELTRSRGDSSVPRLKYADGFIYLKMPTYEHGSLDKLVSRLVEELLIQQNQDFAATTPVMLKIPEQSGIEPDCCFWIREWQAVNGKERIDLAMDPAPDLAIEVEVPSFTNINDYLPFAIPEIWLIRANEIVIHSLGSECYFPVTSSQFLPDVDVAGVYSQVLTAVKSGDSYWRAIRQVIG